MKTTNKYCFLLISVLLWVRIKPIYLNDALFWKQCVCTRVDECVLLCVFWVCVGQQCCCWAPPVRPCVESIFVSVKKTLSVCKIRGSLRLYFRELFLRFSEGAEREYKKEKTWFYFLRVWNYLNVGQAKEIVWLPLSGFWGSLHQPLITHSKISSLHSTCSFVQVML